VALRIEFSKEEQAIIHEKRAKREAEAERRNGEASRAYRVALLEDCDGDESLLVVFTMPDQIGGAVIHRLPSHEYWSATSKRVTKALLSDGRKADSAAAIAALVETPSLLVHPTIAELQAWRTELPDLYAEIHNVMDARCSHGQSAGK